MDEESNSKKLFPKLGIPKWIYAKNEYIKNNKIDGILKEGKIKIGHKNNLNTETLEIELHNRFEWYLEYKDNDFFCICENYQNNIKTDEEREIMLFT